MFRLGDHMICAICISQKLRGKLQMADTISFSFWTDDCMQWIQNDRWTMSLTFGSVDHSVASLLSVGSVGIRKSRESVTRPVSSLDANFSTTDLGVSKYPQICFPRGSTKNLVLPRHSQTQKRSSLIIHPSKIKRDLTKGPLSKLLELLDIQV